MQKQNNLRKSRSRRRRSHRLIWSMTSEKTMKTKQLPKLIGLLLS
jgi:hypothetical protein